jgi:hypothetical protein
MNRIFRIELRRSAALGSALALLVLGVVALFFAEGIGFSTGWMQLAMTQRLYLAVLWPLALAAGAWQARREHRSNVQELFASTPRPRAQRTVPTLAAMAVAVVSGYLMMGLAGGLWIADTAEYLPAPFFVVTAVGALALVAAVWLGLAVGRLLPALVTAPALAVAGLGLLLSIPWATRPHGWLALVFSPIYDMNMPGAYATVPGRASAAQAVWLAALALTAVLLFTSDGWRVRAAAVLPVVLGAALAITVVPHQDRYVNDAIDPVAQELVCAKGDPPVCVSRVHSGLLAEVTPQARQALTILAKLPGGPKEVHEDTTTWFPDRFPARREDVVLLRVIVGEDGHLVNRNEVLAEVVAGAFASPPQCDKSTYPADRLAAASWLIGRAPSVAKSSEPSIMAEAGLVDDASAVAEAAELWQNLRQLPAGEADARVLALRRAAMTCAVEDRLMAPSTR